MHIYMYDTAPLDLKLNKVTIPKALQSWKCRFWGGYHIYIYLCEQQKHIQYMTYDSLVFGPHTKKRPSNHWEYHDSTFSHAMLNSDVSICINMSQLGKKQTTNLMYVFRYVVFKGLESLFIMPGSNTLGSSTNQSV